MQTPVPKHACALPPPHLVYKPQPTAHQPGRTGRAGATGTAYSFFTAANGRLARDIIKIMAEANQVVPPELQSIANTASGGPPSFRGRGRGGGGGGGGYGGGGGGGGRRW
jgi:ATP-dependent RNA helicase DDX5/DBP2